MQARVYVRGCASVAIVLACCASAIAQTGVGEGRERDERAVSQSSVPIEEPVPDMGRHFKVHTT